MQSHDVILCKCPKVVEVIVKLVFLHVSVCLFVCLFSGFFLLSPLVYIFQSYSGCSRDQGDISASIIDALLWSLWVMLSQMTSPDSAGLPNKCCWMYVFVGRSGAGLVSVEGGPVIKPATKDRVKGQEVQGRQIYWQCKLLTRTHTYSELLLEIQQYCSSSLLSSSTFKLPSLLFSFFFKYQNTVLYEKVHTYKYFWTVCGTKTFKSDTGTEKNKFLNQNTD